MSSFSPKHTVYENLAAIAQAVGHVHRLVILEHLAQGERSVEELAERAELSFANTSRHLQILRRARLVETRRDGKHILYSLAGDAEVIWLMRALGRVGERNVAEVEHVLADFFHARDTLEPIAHEELLARLKDGIVTLLDVRPADEFAKGHIQGAVNIPLSQLKRRLGGLPKDREVIAYCRGPYCVYAFEAVAVLRTAGLRARRLENGYPEWKAAGLPVG